MNKYEKVAKEINDKTEGDICFVGEGHSKVEAIPTGIIPLDVITGIGGLPKGRIIEVHGLQSSGKTSLCLAIISAFQKRGLDCAYVDAEFAFSSKHAMSFGVDMDKLLMLKADCGEHAFDAMEKLIRGKHAQLIVVDSVSALLPKPEAESEHGKITIGAQAKLISNGLKKIVGPLAKSGAILIFINQLRVNIMGGQYDPYTLPGGMALRYYSSIMLELHKKSALSVADKQIGVEVEIKVKKNKVGEPNEKCLIQLIYNEGFSGESDLLSMGEKMGYVQKEGNTYSFDGVKLGVGQNKARKHLVDNPEVAAKIKALFDSGEPSVAKK